MKTQRKYKSVLRIFLCAVSFLLSPFSLADTVKVGFANFAPFMIMEAGTGIYHDIINEIAHYTGDELIPKYAPSARLMRDFETNKISMLIGESPAWRKNSPVPGLFSKPFATQVDVVVFQQGKDIPIMGAFSLFGRTVGAVRSYVYPGFTLGFKENQINRYDARDERNLLAFFFKRRIDQIFINKAVLHYWLKKNPNSNNFVIGDEIGSVDLMIRLHPSKQHMMPRLNLAIEYLVESGKIEEIYLKYR